MMGTRNPNHRPPLVETVIEQEPKIEEPVIEKETEFVLDEAEFRAELINLSKKEQIERLKLFGLTKTEIKELKYEADRVDKLVELSGELK